VSPDNVHETGVSLDGQSGSPIVAAEGGAGRANSKKDLVTARSEVVVPYRRVQRACSLGSEVECGGLRSRPGTGPKRSSICGDPARHSAPARLPLGRTRSSLQALAVSAGLPAPGYRDRGEPALWRRPRRRRRSQRVRAEKVHSCPRPAGLGLDRDDRYEGDSSCRFSVVARH
jgi:hypothetical protein